MLHVGVLLDDSLVLVNERVYVSHFLKESTSKVLTLACFQLTEQIEHCVYQSVCLCSLQVFLSSDALHELIHTPLNLNHLEDWT